MKRQADIVIVGAGIWGLSTAYHLAKAGTSRSIIVLERNTAVASETTRQAAGQIGQLRSHPLMANAVRYTLELLSNLKEVTGYDPELNRTGSLHLAQCDERVTSFEAQIDHACALGIAAELADGMLVEKLCPAIDAEAIKGALYVPDDGYVNAHSAAIALGRAVIDLGVKICLETEMTDLGLIDSAVDHVETTQGTIQTNCLVVTAGPWAGRIASMAGITFPIQPIRLQQAQTVPDSELPEHHPVVRIPDQSCYLRPENGGYLFGMFDPDPLPIDPRALAAGFSTADIAPEKDLVDEARRRLAPIFPILEELEIAQYRQGMITCTPDAGYVVGPTPCIRGQWVATGCGGMGIAGSGAIGRWLANWIIDGDPGEDISIFAPPRFKGHDPEWLREECRHVCANYYALESVTYSLGQSGND